MNFWLCRLFARSFSLFLKLERTNGNLIVKFRNRSHRSWYLILSLKYLGLYYGSLLFDFWLLYIYILCNRGLLILWVIKALIFRIQSLNRLFRIRSFPFRWAYPTSVCLICFFLFLLFIYILSRIASSRSLIDYVWNIFSVIECILENLECLLRCQTSTIYLLHLLPYFFYWKTYKVFPRPLHTLISYLFNWSKAGSCLITLWI